MKFPNQAKLLKSYRVKLGLTATDFAKSMGVTLAFISQIERGLQGISVPLAKKLDRSGLSWKSVCRAAAKDTVHKWHKEFERK